MSVYAILFQHFHARYYTGEVKDCKSEHCKTSSSHVHKTARRCECVAVSVAPLV